MKKNIIKIALFAIVMILFMLCTSKSSFAATDIEKIEIYCIEPTIGEELQTNNWSANIVNIEDGARYIREVDTLISMGWGSENMANNIVEAGKQYTADFHFKIKKEFELANSCEVIVNGYKLGIIGDYCEVDGDTEYYYIAAECTFDAKMPRKKISKIKITGPELIVGEKFNTDVSKYSAKINGDTNIELNDDIFGAISTEPFKDMEDGVIEIEAEDYYIQTEFKNNDSYSSFIKTLQKRSIKDFNELVSADDNILTLSTCANNNKYRVVLHAKKVDSIG